jgi:hypothetical protein
MSIDMLVTDVVKFFSWIYYRQWATWEILTIALIILLIRLLIESSHQKAMRKARHQYNYPEIIGKNLIDAAQKY